jgi:hypothetical protein
LKLIDIAVSKNAGREGQLLCGVVDKESAFHKLATIIAGEYAFAAKIEIHALKALAIYDAFFRRISRNHVESALLILTIATATCALVVSIGAATLSYWQYDLDRVRNARGQAKVIEGRTPIVII